MDTDLALDFGLAAAVGFLVGRTREEGGGGVPKPGIRDFVVIALAGGICGYLRNTVLTAGVLAAATVFIAIMKWQHSPRRGLTTELAAVATYLLGYLFLSGHRTLAAALGIALALLLASKEQLHDFALKKISSDEFFDTLRFLSLIFVILPLLPEGGFGPFAFFEPRKIWFFVILVSGVSYVGYFLTKFTDESKGMVLSALVGGLASTTAYTSAMARAAAESPEFARSLAKATVLANSVLFPRMLVIVWVLAPSLAMAAAPLLLVMTGVGLAAAWWIGRLTPKQEVGRADASCFNNPFSLWPALKFGAIFTAVLFLTRAGREWLGRGSEWITALLGGFVDVDAVLVSLAEMVRSDQSGVETAVVAMFLAAAANALFKGGLAASSGVAAYSAATIGGLVVMLASGAVWLLVF